MSSWHLCNQCGGLYPVPGLKQRACPACTAVLYCAGLSRWQLLRLFWHLWRRQPVSMGNGEALETVGETAVIATAVTDITNP